MMRRSLTERGRTATSDGSDSGTPDERLRGTAVPPRKLSRSVRCPVSQEEPG